MAWKDYITNMKKEWIGKEVSFRGEKHTVVDVDYNGGLLIDLADQFKETTAVAPHHLDK